MVYNPLLLLVGVPIITGILCLALPDRLRIVAKSLAFLVTLASLALSVFVFIKKPVFYQFSSGRIFIADNLSAFIAIAIALFAFLVTVYSFGFIQRAFGRYFGYVLITLGCSFGVVFADNFILLLIFWGSLAAMLYLLVNMQATDRAASSAQKAIIIVGGTDAIMMFGICLIWAMTKTFSMSGIHILLNGKLAYAAYFSLVIASFAKAGAMPFHSWLPDVAEDAPTPVTAYLPASLDKLLGIYLLARVSLTIFSMNAITNTALALFGSATIILAVVMALVQHDMKRLLGYHAVSQVGYMVLGIGTGNAIGIAGGIFHMLNHAIYKSCLFLSGGNVEKQTGTTDLDKLGALAKYMPVTFVSFLIASLSISGIPPFNGFVSKWMIYQGIIESAGAKNPLWILWLSSAMFGSALTIASFMKLLHAVFLGRPYKDFSHIKEVAFSMAFPVAMLAFVCFMFGVAAFLLPLPLFILPAVGLPLAYMGTWNPIAATALIIIGIVLGFFAYILIRPKEFRRVRPFIGGEEASSLGRISGTDFYNTVKDMKRFNTPDIYSSARKGVYFFTKRLETLHNGVLPTYMVWGLLGMVCMFLIIFVK